jgi:ribose 5-phosphate isomerase A
LLTANFSFNRERAGEEFENEIKFTMDAKRNAAEKAVELVKDGMVVGLGTGSTATWAIRKIGERVQQGLKIRTIATSQASEQLAMQLRIPMVPFSQVPFIDLTIDGADEVDKKGNLIKGGGGALLREKIVAYNSRKLVIVVDDSKQVESLGRFPLPVEILPFGADATLRQIAALGGQAIVRKASKGAYLTDNGNLVADCHFYPITDPAILNVQLHLIPGVIETGLFMNAMVRTIITGLETGKVVVRELS